MLNVNYLVCFLFAVCRFRDKRCKDTGGKSRLQPQINCVLSISRSFVAHKYEPKIIMVDLEKYETFALRFALKIEWQKFVLAGSQNSV